MFSKFVHLAARVRGSSFLRLRISLDVYYNFVQQFIHWWTFGVFHFRALWSTAMNMGMQISPWDPAFKSFRYIPRNRIGVSCAISNFLRHCHVPFHRGTPFYNPTNSIQGFQFLPIFATFCYFALKKKKSSHPHRYEVVLIGISLIISESWEFFHMLPCYLYNIFR